MRTDDRLVEQVQTANDIVDIISQVVPLKKTGRNFKACCPFHDEKTPSFIVSPEKQIFHCFGCGAGGNVFGFLMRYENLSFPEALRQLAERAHIALPEKQARSGSDASPTDAILDIYRLAAEYYHQIFLDPQKGKAARDYFLGRGFDLSLAKEFKVGWAPEGWRGLFEYLSQKGFSNKLLFQTRLIHQSSQGHPYDVFRNRLMFPIWNLQGKVVAFGGRVIQAGGDGPKYLNSPENPVFQKRRELFGLHTAKKFINRDYPRMLVVEGYLDFLRLYEKGFKASVATLGTALTEEHVIILKRFAEEAVVVYDGDKAGESAALRGLEVFLEGGMSVRLIRLPEGDDPDDYLKREPAENFRKLIAQAQDFFDYKLEVLLKRYDSSESLGLIRITNDFLDTLTKVKNPILMDRYLHRLSGALGVDENSLRRELVKLQAKHTRREGAFAGTGSKSVPVQEKTKPRRAHEEVLMLGLLIDEPKFREEAFTQLMETDFDEGISREIFQRLIRMTENDEPVSWPQILNTVTDDDFSRKLVAIASFEWDEAGRQKAYRDCLKTMQRKRIRRRLDELRQEIIKAERSGNRDLVIGFTKEYQELLQLVK